MANSFFLLIVLLQLVPEFYVVPLSVVAAPMVLIVVITAVKDAVEDYRRYKNDLAINCRLVDKLGGNMWKNYNFSDADSKRSRPPVITGEKGAYVWEKIQWRDIRIGDILKLYKNDPIPADIVVMSTSEQECACFVETKNLDGETNLKLKQGLIETQALQSPEDFGSKLKCLIESEAPNISMNRYQGTVKFTSGETILLEPCILKKVSVSLGGIVLRGTVIKNTEWIVGVVFATGLDTKQVLNSGSTPSKQSETEKLMNFHIGLNLVFMTFLCLACAIGYGIWTSQFRSILFMYGVSEELNPVFQAFINFWAGLILFQNLVPISLYISIEFVKTFQAYFIGQDLELYYEENDTPCNPKTWNLSDNLGQIEYIFSDKTGTLTKNIMEFKKCSIGGMLFDGSVGINLASARSLGSLSKSHRSLVIQSDWIENGQTSIKPKSRRTSVFPGSSKTPVNMSPDGSPIIQPAVEIKLTEAEDAEEEFTNRGAWFDVNLNEIMENPHYPNTGKGKLVNEFFKLLALCHTVLVDTTGADVKKGHGMQLSYKAQSPDEACLVTMAAESGYIFLSRKQNSQLRQNIIQLDINGQDFQYQLLDVLEFDSDRKRMSVVVKALDSDEIIVYCKGADSVIFERLAPEQSGILQRTSDQLEMFAEEGLRTLCLAYKSIPSQLYDEWAMKRQQVMTKIYENPIERGIALELVNNMIERDFTLLGATAIEDKLQDGVPDCITTLMRAGIKIWVLTGDKMETAINIGFLCGLLKSSSYSSTNLTSPSASDMILIQIKNCLNGDAYHQQIGNARQKIEMTKSGSMEFALVIDGISLKFAFDSDENTASLLDLACICKTVICCRVSPLQKAQVVDMVKRNKKVVTLAIGDGANDVSMIQSAHVGVGISGEEGLQAALSADYAIAQFRYLKRLLLVHGRWSYSRNANMLLNFNLKSIAFPMVVFWFQTVCGFSSAVQFEFTYMLLYNQLFTAAPVAIMAGFDRDLSAKTIMKFPEIYNVDGIKQRLYTTKLYFQYLLESIWHSVVVFAVAELAIGEDIVDPTGRPTSLYYAGTIMCMSVIFIVNMSPTLDSHTFTWVQHVFYWGSCALIFLYVFVFSSVHGSVLSDLFMELFGQHTFWHCFVLSIVISLGPRFVYYAVQRQFAPLDSHICEEDQYLSRIISSKKYDATTDFDVEKGAWTPTLPANEIPLRPPQLTVETAITKSSTFDGIITETIDDNMQQQPISSPHRTMTFQADNGTELPSRGFSFSHTLGMAGLMLRHPFSFVNAAYQRSLSRNSNNSRRTSRAATPSFNNNNSMSLDRSFNSRLGASFNRPRNNQNTGTSNSTTVVSTHSNVSNNNNQPQNQNNNTDT